MKQQKSPEIGIPIDIGLLETISLEWFMFPNEEL